ncbi:MAG: carboxypeptidase-like regulatory domain-containing protein [Beijerinckiaceae bacterium]|nr:carboxypeptidase-like regulatory domain-containing protein [Beijerinckiaceae bacterium]
MTQIHAFALAAFVALALSPAPSVAGGADLEAIMGDTEHGAPFFGEATDVKGMKPLEGVRIRAQLKGMPLPVFVNTNEDGRFSLRGFGKGVDPANVDVACEMSGYNLIDLSRRRVSKEPEAATEIECLFEKL